MVSEHLRVLYAENNRDACYLLTTMLKFSNIEVVAAATVGEALRLVQAEHFDLYLLDSRFSDGTGLDLCRGLRKHSPQTPILFYSGDAFKADMQNGLAAGADAYMIKPYFDKFTDMILETIQPLKMAA